MTKRFSSLTKNKTVSLYQAILAKYENFSEIEIEKIYQTLKSKYDRLKIYLDLQKKMKIKTMN
jgi:hypothetical protein